MIADLDCRANQLPVGSPRRFDPWAGSSEAQASGLPGAPVQVGRPARPKRLHRVEAGMTLRDCVAPVRRGPGRVRDRIQGAN
jgi:hypothetical protein